MSMIWTILYVIASVVFIWWVLGQAKKLDTAHGGEHHGQNAHHDAAEEQKADDLTRISGIGAVIAPRLQELGITTFEQIANFTAADVERINGSLKFKGRIEREKWVEQARRIIESDSA